MKAFVFALLLMVSSACFSQSKRYLYYFDKDLNLTPKGKALLNRVGTYTANLFEIKFYRASNNNLLWSQHFMDSSVQVSEGTYQSYYPDGTLESAGNYSKNSEDGLWQKWDSSGII
jgi:antitoxin component YwqK of YwqJK toxin-antitoxin module